MINKEQTLKQLQELNLKGMAQTYEGLLSLSVQQQPTAHELIARLTESELQSRNQLRTETLLRQSKLRYNAILEDIYCTPGRNLSTDQLQSLSDCSFIEKAENLLITGATGCGKSYLAYAIGRQACRLGYKTMYIGMNRFLEKIAIAKLDGSYLKLLNQMEKSPLIILDDFGLYPLDNTVKLTLLQLLEDRYGRHATIITSQLPVTKWYEYLSEPTLADAIMDRLSGSAHKIELKGESLRRKKVTQK